MYCPNYRAGLSHKTAREGYNPFDDKMRYTVFGGWGINHPAGE